MDRLSNAALHGAGRDIANRLPLPDLARGAAVLAMIVYHFAWDLSELNLVETRVAAEPGWRAFAIAIAASFLTLSGIGLGLAHRGGIRTRSFLRRLATVAGAAGAVTVGTYLVFPDSYVFFGILHCIALGSVLALPFLRAPAWMSAVAVPALMVAPLVLTHGVFDTPVLAFLGLGTRVPVTNDYVPLAPWAGFVFAGLALSRAAPRLPAWPGPAFASSRPAAALAWLGRHSLVIYLLHQPILFGALSGLAALTGPNPAAEAAPFLRSCEASCRETGASGPTCRAACTCAVEAIKGAGLWRGVVANRLVPEQSARIGELARACFARPR